MKVTIGYNAPNVYFGVEHFQSGDIILSEQGAMPYFVYEVFQKEVVAFPLGPGGIVTKDAPHGPMMRFRALRTGERVVIEGE